MLQKNHSNIPGNSAVFLTERSSFWLNRTCFKEEENNYEPETYTDVFKRFDIVIEMGKDFEVSD